MDIGGFDDKIWCEDCDAEYLEVCPQHGAYIQAQDKSIPSRARLTAPYYINIRELQITLDPTNVYGVFAKKIIQKRTQFGPYEGLLTEKWLHSRQDRIELRKCTPDGRKLYWDCTDENTCNWMMFVRPASKDNPRNIVAIQHKGLIYFITTNAIRVNEELRVEYSRSYEKLMKKCDISPNQGCQSEVGNTASYVPEKPTERGRKNLDSSITCTEVTKKPKGRPRKNAQQVKTIEKKVSKFSSARKNCRPRKLAITKPAPTALVEDDSENEILSFDVPNCEEDQQSSVASTNSLKEENPHIHTEVQHNTNDVTIKDTTPNKNDTSPLIGRKIKTSPRGVVIIKPAPCVEEMQRENGFKSGVFIKSLCVKKSFDCPHCELVFSSQAKLDEHMVKHNGKLPYHCKEPGCRKKFATHTNIRRHMITHGDTKAEFTCVYCEKVFKRKDHLKSHMNVHNTDKQTFNCEECDKVYYSQYAMRCHVAKHNIEKGDLTCYVCKKVFKDKAAIEYHLKVHLGSRETKSKSAKKHACPTCEMRFFSRAELGRHVVTHKDERAFLCDLCPRRFGRMDHLKRHMDTVHSPKKTGQKTAQQPTQNRPKKDAVDRIAEAIAFQEMYGPQASDDAVIPIGSDINELAVSTSKDVSYNASIKKKRPRLSEPKTGQLGKTQTETLPTCVEALNMDDSSKGKERLSSNSTGNDILSENSGLLMGKQQPTVVIQPTAILAETVAATLSNLATLQPVRLQAQDTEQIQISSQNNLQHSSTLLTHINSEQLNLLQNQNLSDLEMSGLVKYLSSTESNDGLTKLLKASEKVQSEAAIESTTKDQSSKDQSAMKDKTSKGKTDRQTKRTVRKRGSSSRSSLTSQPTISVDQLEGVSHLAGPVNQSSGSGEDQNEISVSFIDKNLTAMFGEGVRSLQNRQYMKLLADLKSFTCKIGKGSIIFSETSSANQNAIPSQAGVITSASETQNSDGEKLAIVSQSSDTLNPSSGSLTQTFSLSNIPSLVHLDSALLQQIFGSNTFVSKTEPIVITPSQGNTSAVGLLPQHVQLVQLFSSTTQSNNDSNVVPSSVKHMASPGQSETINVIGTQIMTSSQDGGQYSQLVTPGNSATENAVITIPDNWNLIIAEDTATEQQ